MIGLLGTLIACPGLPPLERNDPTPVLVVNADGFEFGALQTGEEATQDFTVTNAGDLELSLELSLEGSPDFTVPSVNRPYFLEPEETRTFEVNFSPSAEQSTGTLVLTSDDPEVPALDLPLLGYGALPVLSVDPLEHDFGSVGVNCEEELVVTLENTGSADLTLASIAHSGLGFSIVPAETPLILAPQEWLEIAVALNLKEPGSAHGQLFVVSDAASGQIVANQYADGDELVGGCD
jgi:hypothetical protein